MEDIHGFIGHFTEYTVSESLVSRGFYNVSAVFAECDREKWPSLYRSLPSLSVASLFTAS